ncbi:MAG: hypothetical protein ACKOWG_00375, partial [Planctomycetia bacterium]
DKQSWHGLVGRLRLDAARLSRDEIESGSSREAVFDWRFDDPAAIGHDASGNGRHAEVSYHDPDWLSPHDQARAALVHALLNSSEMLYLD